MPRQPARIGQCRLTRFRAPRPLYSAMSWPTTRRCTAPFSMSSRHRSANSACICAPTTCSPKRLGQAAPLPPETVQQALGQLVDWGNLPVATGHSPGRDNRRLLPQTPALPDDLRRRSGRGAGAAGIRRGLLRGALNCSPWRSTISGHASSALEQLMRESPPDAAKVHGRTSGSRACVRRLIEQRGGLHGGSRTHHRAPTCRGSPP